MRMQPKLLTFIAFLFAGALLHAQTHVDEVSIDTRATFHQQTTDGVYDSHFQGDYLNLHIKGQLADNLTFRVRQRLNKEIDEKNPFRATDFLWLKWKASPKWSFTAGKQAILIGGYEIDSPPIDVYYYGAFSSRLYQYYAFGATATYSPAPGQDISFEFCPSPISPGTQDAYSYNLYWSGHIGPIWKTTWSYNYVEDELHRKMNWIVLGNKFFFGDLVVDVKFGYEKNAAENVDENGISYDLVLPAGHDFLYGGAGVEYFPLGDDRLRLHAVYFRDNHDRVNNFDVGITWRFNIYKR